MEGLKMSKIYNLFVSHSWSYGENYVRLLELINQGRISYKDYSVPKDDPIHNAKNDKELYEAIKRQIKPASVVLILAGVYATYSKWINKEIEIAKELGKPIIAVEYWGAEKTSKVVKDNADRIVKWQSSSIVSAIKELG
jgi:hypothetical protein